MRKRFLKDASGQSTSFPTFNQNHTNETELQNENDSLAKQVQELKLSKESSRETIQILEEKIAKIEAKAMKDYKESSEKNNTLKCVIKS